MPPTFLRPRPNRRLLAVAGFAVALVLVLAPSSLEATATGGVVSNGTVALGVTALGDLGYDCGSALDPSCPDNPGNEPFGVRFLPNGTDATSAGCPCEGWGVADAASGLTGYANETTGDAHVSVESFVADATSAVSTVSVSDPALPGYALRVTHAFHSTPLTPNLIAATVTVTNTGTSPIANLLYRRVMDWDIEPTPFHEWVTIQNPSSSPQLLFDSDDGFASADPLSGPSYASSEAVCGTGYTGVCTFTDLGLSGTYPTVTTPDDHGSLFDFQFGALPPGDSQAFTIFYGAAPSEADMLAALDAVGAEVYSLGEPNCPFPGAGGACGSLPANAGVEVGEPNTFGFGFVTTSADVSITNVDSPDPVTAGGSIAYTLHVHNAGPNDAAAVSVSDPLPAGVSLDSVTTTAGSCSGTTTISCALGTLASGADATVTIHVTTSAAGQLDNTATVSTTSADPSSANNTATATTTVAALVDNHPPDCATVRADPSTLWPPDHTLRLVTLSGGADADGDSLLFAVSGVTQNEPAGANGPDWAFGAAPNKVRLRAERDGTEARVYAVAFTLSDPLGASCTGTVTVAVAHDMRAAHLR